MTMTMAITPEAQALAGMSGSQEAESAKQYFHLKNQKSSELVEARFPNRGGPNGVRLTEGQCESIRDEYEKEFASGAYGKIIFNLGLGKYFQCLAKATNKANEDDGTISRAKAYASFGVSGASAALYIKMADNEDIVMGTIDRALDTGEPISQDHILRLIGTHEVFKHIVKQPVPYLQAYEDAMLAGLSIVLGGGLSGRAE